MGAPIKQRKDLVEDDRSGIDRALRRAVANTTRPKARNQKILQHLKALSALYLEDLTDSSAPKRLGASS